MLVDLDAFFASVEELERPELRDKPLLIGGSPSQRGVVAAASYEARKFGCYSAMPMAQALRRCPHAVVLPTRHALYREYSHRVMELLQAAAPSVQQVSVDEAYVELTTSTETMEEAEAIAHQLQGRIRLDVGLPSSVGLAASKLVAKVACEEGKPAGFVVVPPGTEAGFLAGLPAESSPASDLVPRSGSRLRASKRWGRSPRLKPQPSPAFLGRTAPSSSGAPEARTTRR